MFPTLPVKEKSVYLHEALRELGLNIKEIIPLQGDGSARKFLRIKTPKESFILILPQPGEYGLREAQAYYRIGRFLKSHGIPVPDILAYRDQDGLLLVEDLGDLRLCEHPERERLYPEAVKILVNLQALTPRFPRETTLETLYYDRDLIWHKEILYFEKWYLKIHRKKTWFIETRSLLEDFLQESVDCFTDTVVLHRDFQSRNLMVKNGRLYVIDFQGARIGPPSYDLASLLWDPYVERIPTERLLDLYLRLTSRDRQTFLEEFKRISIFRLMQALGAFVKLSSQGKSWFRDYIPRAEKRLRKLLPSYLRKALFE
ncbi:aminoglycoside phosphotransferase family protein [Thermosulfurimonas dismutans]|uniref:Putative phosphotransferase n=1 Tax=Thermosulfurimonas dismutans TaxID=999894 RepID=A0A179D329_9BACT|nr:phosphotransferase [Thermosulfurimonas dismutans]OAQ20201.1 putative phosphotransferase [Thermosulfurimonas dismutans]